MKHIKQTFTKRMAQKGMAQLSIGAFLVEQAKRHVQYPGSMTGYVRRHTLFLKLSPRENKAKLFVEKNKLREQLNKTLKDFGYGYVLKDIRFV